MRAFFVIASLGVMSSGVMAESVFLPGVTLEEGWYDCNKRTKWNDQGNALGKAALTMMPQDSELCWAAAAANVLQWWQDSKTELGNVPNGAAENASYLSSVTWLPQVSQLAIFRTIAKDWGNVGGCVEQAYNYWFNGGMLDTNVYEVKGTPTVNSDSGGYWKELGLIVPPSINGEKAENPLFQSISFATNDTIEQVSTSLTDAINNGYGVTLSILAAVTNSGVTKPGGHAITMWGYQQQDDGTLIVYITDSDDYKHELVQKKLVSAVRTLETLDQEGNVNGVSTYNYFFLVDPESEETITLSETFDPEEQYVADLLHEAQFFTAPRGDFAVVPEPASAFLALLGAGGFVVRRRRLF